MEIKILGKLKYLGIGILIGLAPICIILTSNKKDDNIVIITERTGIERPAIEKAENLDDFIKSVCEAEGVPYYFAIAILAAENESRNPSAINQNEDKTMDLGLWQLNNHWLFHDFIDRHWKTTEEFNWADPKDNTILAVRHIAWLYEFGFTDYQVAVAYNKGYTVAQKSAIGTDSYALKVLRLEVELLQEVAKQ
jgi:hypothetical protein